MTTATAAFSSDASSVAAARRFVVGALGDTPPDLRQRVELLVSELATNAVRHARSAFAITVDRRPGAVRVEVDDHGPGAPEQRNPTPRQPHGRGLLIVDQLSDEWGVLERGGGKTVWFRLSVARGASSGAAAGRGG